METIIDKRQAFAALCGKSPTELFSQLKTPCYIIDEKKIINNCKILQSVIEHTGCKILLAQKAFSNFDFYKAMAEYISGTEASGLYEARLGFEEMPEKEVHVFCGAYKDDEFNELLKYADHIVFNSVNQLRKFGHLAKSNGKSIGIRINPEHSTQDGHEIYDPCAPGSRLGVTRSQWDYEMTDSLFELLDGIHFHTLCEQNSDALEETLFAVENKFGDIFNKMKWLNMGGGHHITKAEYNVEKLEKCINYAQSRWNVDVYLEPGEACALNAGFLATRVLDITKNGSVSNIILDTSAACHMPDVIEMPYTPPLYNATTGKGKFNYRLGGPTCLSGDVIGDYGFINEVKIGDMLLFGDMAIYSTCKNNTFNGMPLPQIYRLKTNGTIEKLTNFDYFDFKSRLGKSNILH